MNDISVAYIIFNRPRHTRETFAAIRAQRPPRLFIIADGPRPGHPTDAQRCRETREIVEQIEALDKEKLRPERVELGPCPRCGAESWNPNDAANRYCGRCHEFVDDAAWGRR